MFVRICCLALSLLIFGSVEVLADDFGVARSDNTKSPAWAIAVHGGCGDASRLLPDEVRREYLAALRAAIDTGRRLLADGSAALDVVEEVAVHLENDPHFNAGKGAIFNREGRHELDASIMDGRTLGCGGVAGLTRTKNPILVARLVMEKTNQVLLAGPGADRFALEMNVPQVNADYFYTPRLRDLWNSVHESGEPHVGSLPLGIGRGTIGVVALDVNGNLAAATSTGGRMLKPPGRVGDSPIVGAGTYAKNGVCAVSCTGTGEEFIRHSIARSIAARIQYQSLTLAQAVDREIHHTLQPNMGGCISVGADGAIVMDFNTKAMLRAAADSTGRLQVKIWE